MKKLLLAVLAVLIAGIAFAHWYFADRGRFTTEAVYTDLSRTVQGNTLISDHDPPAILRFDPSYRYLGGQKFILYGVADTEQHFFAETTEDDVLKSLYWVQYEAYLPGKFYSYDYDDSRLRVTLGELEFFTDAEAVSFDPDRKRKQGTDGARAREFLATKGYQLPPDWAYARLVYLTDETRKKELMIIFVDDLERYGLAAEELLEGGSTDRWPEIERAHLDRIRATLEVAPLG